MKQDELKQFIGVPVEVVILDLRMVLIGTLEKVNNSFAKFSTIENLFVLVHGRRLSIKLMLSGSFIDLEALLTNLWFPCSIFNKCRRLIR
jgi:hypothetical protein